MWRCSRGAVALRRHAFSSSIRHLSSAPSSSAAADESSSDRPWENPWKHALPQKSSTFTSFKEVAHIDWANVESVLPKKVVPDVPQHSQYPTPTGWRPPKDPPPELSYWMRRKRDHLLPVYLERRRDLLNEKTIDFDFVELVVVRGLHGDIFACNKDLSEWLEARLGRPVATNVDELKATIKVKGADRAIVEEFFFEKGF